MYVGDVRRLSKPFASLKICQVLTTGIHRTPDKRPAQPNQVFGLYPNMCRKKT